MGIGSRLKGIFMIKKKESLPEIKPIEFPKPVTTESAASDNLKAKIELMLTQMESLNVKYDTLNGRMDRIEKTLNEIYAMAKGS